MKLRRKMVLWSLLLFIAIINIFGLVIIESSHLTVLRSELSRDQEQQQNLSLGMGVFLQDNIANTKGFELQILRSYVDTYTQNAIPEGAYLEILRQNHTAVYQNFPGKLSLIRPELQNLKPDIQKYIIRDIGDKSYLFVSSYTTVGGENFIVSYIRDITSIYEKRHREYTYFFMLDLLACLLFGMGIGFISRKITFPLVELTRSAEEIARGIYSQRVIYNHNDELGALAQSFNHMAGLIEENIRELNESARQKQQFIDNFTHELRTPLTSIIGYSELLKNPDLPPANYQTCIENINNEGKRIQHLYENMLKLVKLRQANLNMEKLNARDMFAQVLQSFKIKFAKEQVNLIIASDDYFFYGDRELCYIMLGNLLENALKASLPNSNVILGVLDQPIEAGIYIKDEGAGIPKESADKLFEPFYTTDASRTGQNGLGLGLAICSQIAVLHDWRLKVESELGKGTQVKIIMQV